MEAFVDWWNWTDGQEHLRAFLVLLTAGYCLGTVALLVYVWFVMMNRKRRLAHLAELRSRFEDDVAVWLAGDLTTWELGDRFQRALREDDRARPVLVDVLFATSKLLRSEAQPPLRDLFRRLLLHRYCIRLLKSWNWARQAYGVSVIGQLQFKEALSLVRARLKTRKSVLRVEAITALVAMGNHTSLRRVEEAGKDLSDWEQLLLLERFKALDMDELPPFEDWLASSYPDWVLFGIRLCRHYNRLDKMMELGPLLYADDPRVQVAVLGAFEYLGDPDVAPFVQGYIPRATGQPLIRALKLYAELADLEAAPVLGEHLQHPDPLVRRTALDALRQLGLSGDERTLFAAATTFSQPPVSASDHA
jgi:hypothetical protein